MCTAWIAFDCDKDSILANCKNLNLHNEVHTNSLWSKGHLTGSVRSIDGRISFPNVISCTRLKNKTFTTFSTWPKACGTILPPLYNQPEMAKARYLMFS